MRYLIDGRSIHKEQQKLKEVKGNIQKHQKLEKENLSDFNENDDFLDDEIMGARNQSYLTGPNFEKITKV